MNLTVRLAERSDCYRRNLRERRLPPEAQAPPYRQYYAGPRGVMLHSTGADNPSLARYVGPNPYGNDWNRPGLDVCVHAFVGKTEEGRVASCQCLPWEYRAWHCGGTGNNTHLSIELCEDGLTDGAYFAAVYREAAELTAWLCQKFGLDPEKEGVLLDHAQAHALSLASNHADVTHWFTRHGKTMADFRREVKALLENSEIPRYQTLDQLPAWAKPHLERLQKAGILNGTERGLDLTPDMVRILVMLDRATG